MTEPICGSIHPKVLELHCKCKKSPHHPGSHECYGCGFRWDQGDPQSRMPNETDETLFDVLGITPEIAEQMNADFKKELRQTLRKEP